MAHLTETADRFGAFGKIPAIGDFFRLAPPVGFVDAWDPWVQTLILQTQATLGDRWDAHYMSAPIWRFCLSAGLAGPQKVLGVLMPSVDRVGRRFPLTLMSALNTPGPAQLDHFSEARVFDQLEDLALAALEDDMTRDALDAGLGAILPPHRRATVPVRAFNNTLVLTQTGGGGILPDLAAALLGRRVTRPSLWTAVIGDEPRMMICEGLPEGPEMQALFDLNAPIWREADPI